MHELSRCIVCVNAGIVILILTVDYCFTYDNDISFLWGMCCCRGSVQLLSSKATVNMMHFVHERI